VLQLTLDMLAEEDVSLLGEPGVAATDFGLRRGRFMPEAAIPERQTTDASNPI
jgi:hypothetical protein